MKNNPSKPKKKVEELRAEYDFSGGVRGKHADAYHKGHTVTVHKSITWGLMKFKDNPLFYIEIVLTFFVSWVILELSVVVGQKLGVIFNLAIHTAFLIIFSGLQIGFMKICLGVYTEKTLPYSELFKSINQGANFLVAQLAYVVMILMGLLLIIPGFYLGTKFAFFGFHMAENNNSIINSFYTSAALTDNFITKLAYYLFLLVLLNLLGAALLGLGLLITVPISVLTMTSLYEDLKSKV